MDFEHNGDIGCRRINPPKKNSFRCAYTVFFSYDIKIIKKIFDVLSKYSRLKNAFRCIMKVKLMPLHGIPVWRRNGDQRESYFLLIGNLTVSRTNFATWQNSSLIFVPPRGGGMEISVKVTSY